MAFGLSIGRSSAQFAIVDLLGEIGAIREIEFAYPDRTEIQLFTAKAATEPTKELGVDGDKFRSFGVGMSSQLWQWPRAMGGNITGLQAWKAVQMAPHVFDDSSAACFGELVSGSGRVYTTVFYINVGTVVGGGIALESSFFTCANGTAANIAAIPVRDRSGQTRQLWEIASLWPLVRGFKAARKLDDASDTAAVRRHGFPKSHTELLRPLTRTEFAGGSNF